MAEVCSNASRTDRERAHIATTIGFSRQAQRAPQQPTLSPSITSALGKVCLLVNAHGVASMWHDVMTWQSAARCNGNTTAAARGWRPKATQYGASRSIHLNE